MSRFSLGRYTADVIGIVPNDEAIVRLVGALMLETNDEWTVARRYISLERLARVTDTATVRLSAVGLDQPWTSLKGSAFTPSLSALPADESLVVSQ